MFCAQCGSDLASGAKFCYNCGAVVTTIPNARKSPDDRAETPDQQEPSTTRTSQADSNAALKGVEGWLLFLCWMLTIVSPLIMLWQIGMEWKETSPAFAAIPNLRTLVAIETALNVLMMAFSILAGVSLWKLKPNAVIIAKAYFVVVFIYSISIPFILTGLVDLPSEISRAIENEGAKQAGRGLISSVIWLWYLGRSKRVRATYS